MSSLEGERQLMARMHAMEKAPEEIIKRVVIKAVRYAKIEVPRKTGNLGRTIRPGHITSDSGQVIAGGKNKVGYARVIELGLQGPVTITPKNKKALAWGGARRLSGSLRSGASATHFATKVTIQPSDRHPHPYLVPSLRKALDEEGIEAVIDLWNGAA